MKEDITDRKAADDALQRRMELLSLIARTSAQLIVLPTSDISDTIFETIAAVGALFDGPDVCVCFLGRWRYDQ